MDTSQVFNGTLLTQINLEKKIQDVIRKVQSLAIVATQDIKEAFFRLRLSPAAKRILFLMDINSQGELTADDAQATRLVGVKVNISVIGVSQTPLLLALVRGDLHLDAILQFMIREMAYVDDLPTSVLPKEIEALQQELFPSMGPLRPAACADMTCCLPLRAAGEPTCRPMGFTTPQDKLRATQHLMQKEFGQRITHILVLQGANLALSLARANMPVKDLVKSLAENMDATFLAEAVKSYCKTLHQGATPAFSQLQMMTLPEGWCQNNDKKWYLPWTRTSRTPASPTLTNESRDPVLQLANAQQAPLSDAGEGQETLLGYK